MELAALCKYPQTQTRSSPLKMRHERIAMNLIWYKSSKRAMISYDRHLPDENGEHPLSDIYKPRDTVPDNRALKKNLRRRS